MSFTCKEPKLRFPEFRGKWEEKKLGEITNIVDSLHQTPQSYSEQGFPMIRVTDVNDSILKIENCLKVSEEVFKEFTKKYEPQINDIVLSRVGTCGASIQLSTKDKVCLGQNTVLLKSKINQSFFFILLKSNIVQKQVNHKVVGSTQKTLSLKDLKKFSLHIPSKPEQEKIASFLTAVDVKIEQLTCKEKLLQKYKKSAMQKLFSQELRFTCNDGSAFPEWEEKKLGEVGQIITGKTPSTSNDDFWDGDIQFITPTDINENTKYQILTVRKIVKQPNTKVLPKGSIVYTCIASIGKMAITTLPSITNQQINSIIAFGNVNNEFLYYALLKLTPYIKSTQANTTLPIINKTEFSKFKINLPSLPEQTKIANFLSAIDEKCLHVKHQLEQTKQFKKALLQQMFV